MLARIEPEMLCQTENMAPGTVAIARVGNVVAAKLEARPEFCMPISIDRAFVFAGLSLSDFPITKPHPQPRRLCNITTRKTILPLEKISAEFLEMMAIIIVQIAITEMRGRILTNFCVNFSKNLFMRKPRQIGMMTIFMIERNIGSISTLTLAFNRR